MKTAMDTIDELRTIHGDFAERDIPDEVLEKIVRSSVKAANSSARQAYAIVVTRRKDVMASFGYTGACMLIYCADYHRQRKLAHYHGFSPGPLTIRRLMLASIDATLAAQTAVIAAKAQGVDSLVTNCIHRGDMNRVYTALDLPEKDVFPVIAVVLGYPVSEETRKKGRLDDKAVIHTETYKAADSDECRRLTERYDREDLGLVPPETWKEQGFNHYLEWFFKRWSGFSKLSESTEEKNDAEKDQYDEIAKRSGLII